MKQQLIAIVMCLSFVVGLNAAHTRRNMQGAKMTIDNQTRQMAHVEIEKNNDLGEISAKVRPGRQRTFMAKEHCFDEIEVRLGSARIFGRREAEVHGKFCGEHTIQVLPDNTKRGFHLKVVK